MEEVANVRKLCEDIFQDYKSRFVPQISHANTSGVSRSNHVNFGGNIVEGVDDIYLDEEESDITEALNAVDDLQDI
ncbi:hypothetical protein EZV62_007832 [Acer yangbiense]|uniref:hAT-like transposase RNase-H fold domain-containing protein n=1 Tax=Acer yangbiense TaxID=1000413 RepID=A0A5C7IBG5_9ROSI|nr:hypothetical protein EZV62_007832 [Acer yangbiense]